MAFSKAAIAALLAAVALSAEAVEVTATSTEVRGVTIVSADIASDIDDQVQMLVVRLRNSADEAGQEVTLAVSVHDKSGTPRGIHAQKFEVKAAPQGDQVLLQAIPSFTNASDILTVELVDVDEWARESQ